MDIHQTSRAQRHVNIVNVGTFPLQPQGAVAKVSVRDRDTICWAVDRNSKTRAPRASFLKTFHSGYAFRTTHERKCAMNSSFDPPHRIANARIAAQAVRPKNAVCLVSAPPKRIPRGRRKTRAKDLQKLERSETAPDAALQRASEFHSMIPPMRTDPRARVYPGLSSPGFSQPCRKHSAFFFLLLLLFLHVPSTPTESPIATKIPEPAISEAALGDGVVVSLRIAALPDGAIVIDPTRGTNFFVIDARVTLYRSKRCRVRVSRFSRTQTSHSSALPSPMAKPIKGRTLHSEQASVVLTNCTSPGTAPPHERLDGAAGSNSNSDSGGNGAAAQPAKLHAEALLMQVDSVTEITCLIIAPPHAVSPAVPLRHCRRCRYYCGTAAPSRPFVPVRCSRESAVRCTTLACSE